MRETDLYEQLARYLNLKYPRVVYHFDLSGLWTPSHQLRNLYGRLNARAWPDLFIAQPCMVGGVPLSTAAPRDWVYEETSFGGLFLELKREGSKLKKRDGSWASPH